MATCHVCKTYIKIDDLRNHYKYYHANVTSYECINNNDCFRRFSNLSTFIGHVRTKHNEEKKGATVQYMEIDSDPALDSMNINNSEVNRTVNINLNINSRVSEIIEKYNSVRSDECNKFIAKLFSDSSTPTSRLQSIIDDVSQLFGEIYLNNFKSMLLEICSIHNFDSTVISVLTTAFDKLKNPLNYAKSKYRSLDAIEKKSIYVAPESYVISTKLVKKLVKKKMKLNITKVTGQYIPLKRTLKVFLEMPGVLNTILNYIEKLKKNDEYIENIIQTLIWKEKTKSIPDDKIVLPIFIYFDDVEPNNPLGAHSGKLGAVYAMLGCLPPECESTLKNIFLVLLFYSKDRSKYGNQATFKRLIDDLNDLETNGISIQTSEGEKKVYIILALVIGDNLGLHSLLGFTEGFRNAYACRFCKVPASIKSTLYTEDITLLRTKENYLEDLLKSNVTITGLKEDSVFNKLKSFHVVENFCVDLMHDILEGVCHYDMSLLLHHYIHEKKYFTLEILNQKLSSFDFGMIEKRNTPQPIKEARLEKGVKLKMTASEMLTFVRFFGFLIGDFVPEDDKHWNLFILLREIIDIVMAKILSKNIPEHLTILIKEHNSLYIQLSKSTLTPKFHHLLHYPRVFKMSGPFIHFSCMRFESKHQEIKRACHTPSRVNLPKTAARRYQLNYFYKCFSKEEITPKFKISVLKTVKFTECENFLQFKEKIPIELNINNNYTFAKTITYKGTEYAINYVITVGIDELLLPIFGIIKHIVMVENEPMLIGILLSTIGFNSHLYAHQINLSDDWFCIHIISLYDPKPLTMNIANDGYSYVILKNVI